ncbi:MAG: translation elongation factor 4, partial [Clostridia bacterium]|nr:translation elongation factor 4 [Clostridia bacterium]
GVIAYIRVIEGQLRTGMTIRMMATGKEFEITDLGIFRPDMHYIQELKSGEVGFLAASIKNVKDCRVGDTVTSLDNPAPEPLPGYRQATPMVYCGLYPVDTVEYENLRDALEKLKLNDASLLYEAETSEALGFGFRCGFLGLLHMEIIQERLEREYDLALITTAPSVVYRITKTNGEILEIDNPTKIPSAGEIELMEEPFVKATIMVPKDFVGTIMDLAQERRGVFKTMEYLGKTRVMLIYELPLSEIIYDFFDQLKSRTKGYASLDYEWSDYQPSNLVKLDIMINGEVLDALTCITHKDKAAYRGRQLVEKLRSLIPRQLFDVPVQAAIGTRIIARETVKARRKDVLAKCYGGDITRKR